jgi:hypothetical protein
MSQPSCQPGSAKFADKFSGATRSWRRFLPLGLACSVPQLLRAENRADYRYEYYVEDNDRMTIETHSVYFEQKLLGALAIKGELVYDSVSGATPIGTHDIDGKAIIQHIAPDIRRAANVELDWKLGNHLITPAFAYSKEHDYESYGISLNDAIEFNEKNTTLQFGLSHNFDSVKHDGSIWTDKQSTEGFIGISQLLSPKDIFTAAVTFGNDSGYLTDPYRLSEYHPDIFPDGFNVGVPERRPAHRNKEVVHVSLTHHFDSLDASIEGSYRFYHDSYGVLSHTVMLGWHQWLGKHLIIEPQFRFNEQSAADFYTTTFTGPFTFNPDGYHSSDYRLSNFYSLDYGLQATVIINDHLRIIGGYHRYEMNGLDNTTADMYPKAHVFTIGLSISW